MNSRTGSAKVAVTQLPNGEINIQMMDESNLDGARIGKEQLSDIQRYVTMEFSALSKESGYNRTWTAEDLEKRGKLLFVLLRMNINAMQEDVTRKKKGEPIHASTLEVLKSATEKYAKAVRQKHKSVHEYARMAMLALNDALKAFGDDWEPTRECMINLNLEHIQIDCKLSKAETRKLPIAEINTAKEEKLKKNVKKNLHKGRNVKNEDEEFGGARVPPHKTSSCYHGCTCFHAAPIPPSTTPVVLPAATDPYTPLHHEAHKECNALLDWALWRRFCYYIDNGHKSAKSAE